MSRTLVRTLSEKTRMPGKEENQLAAFVRSGGLDVYEPNRKAFRDHALEVIAKSKYVKEWKPGMLERINAL